MKILIVKLSSMGDVICALPAVTDAINSIYDISFDWVVEENFSEIPAWHPAIDKIIPIAMRRWRKQPFKSNTLHQFQSFLNNLRSQKYDCIIDIQGLIKSAVVSKISRGISCGFNSDSAREPLASIFYNNKYAVSKKLHTVERMRQLFALSLEYPIPTNSPNYDIDKNKLLLNSACSKENYLVFVHGASRDNKCWQVEKWVELARFAKTCNLKIKLPWGNEEELNRAKYILSKSNNVEIIPKSSLTDIGAILLNSKGVVAVDTGFAHLSVALEIPTISLHGPTDPNLGGAYGESQNHITNMFAVSADEVCQKIKTDFKI